MPTTNDKIKVQVISQYIADKSIPEENRFVFGYHVTIANNTDSAAQIKARHWVITDADGDVEEISGPGVVGEKPWIAPGDTYEYMSGAIIKTPVGAIEGHYDVQQESGEHIKAPIPAFSLSVPNILH